MTSTPDFLDALRRFHLLEPAQLDELARKLQLRAEGRQPPVEPRALAQKLIQQGWLTPYQVNQLLQGRGQQLLLGSYVLLERLGEGGMGEVFKAKNWKLGKIVAIKLIRKERLANEAAVKRFHREIRSAASLSHPNVVHAFDADQVGTTHLLVMEYVEGIDLAKLVKESGPLAISRACEYIRQAACGLAHAHEKGMVHRDIKPHNLLLAVSRDPKGSDPSATVKILDMGLARMARPEGDDESSSTLTKEGSVMGTLDYIAPEQAMDSHTVDIRADLYSLGCTFYFVLTGKVPFPGGDALAKLMKHKLEEPTPVEQLRPDVPAGVAAVVRKLMAKQPEDRFQTPAELAAVLDTNPTRQRGLQPAPSLVPHPPSLARRVSEPDDTIAAGTTPPALARGFARRRLLALSTVGAALLGLLILFLGIFLLSGDNSGKAQLATSAQQTKPAEPPKEIVNSIGMKLAYIPAGEFTMGSPDTEANREGREGPQHKVKITKAFYMGVYEVKQSEFEQLSKNQSAFKDPSNPAENVTWDEAVDFCKRLSELPDEKKAGRVYRLPTEAEWEYACRATTTTVFHYGNSLSSKQANFNGEQPYGGAEKGVRIGKTVKCGLYQANAWSLYDMHGNVWEWCLDDARTYTPNAVEDPRGSEAAGGSRVLRGGSWSTEGFACRAARRAPLAPSNRGYSVGFRVVLLR